MKTYSGVDIYETLSEIVQPSHSCLVVWDVQEGLVRSIFNQDAFLTSLASLIEGVRGHMPIVYTRITPLPKDFQSGWFLQRMMHRFGVDDPAKMPAFMAPGSPEREIPERVRPQPGDIEIDKATPNIFLGTNFELTFRKYGCSSCSSSLSLRNIFVNHFW